MPWKRVKFDAMGQNNDADPVLLQYIGGKFVTIFPPQAAVAEASRPMNVRCGGGIAGGSPDRLRLARATFTRTLQSLTQTWPAAC